MIFKEGNFFNIHPAKDIVVSFNETNSLSPLDYAH